MRRPPRRLCLLELERRLAPASIVVDLIPDIDQFGDQIPAVQAYGDLSRTTFSIFDTGASAITFAPADQEGFALGGSPIPIKVPGGAIAGGIGGVITGDVSQPGTIIANGMHAVTFNWDDIFNLFQFDLGGDSVRAPGIQAFVGTYEGSPGLPTITGTPILEPSPQNPAGLAARIDMQGYAFDVSALIPDLVLPMPDLHFVTAGTALPAPVDTTTTAPVYVPLEGLGEDNHLNPADQITSSLLPTAQVKLTNNLTVPAPTVVSDQRFLFDTGAQLSVVSTDLALALGFDLDHPEFQITVGGVGGNVDIFGFILSELTLPTTDPATFVQFREVPIYVLDVDPSIDGILGMNLFNTAQTLIYDPFHPAGSRLGLTFFNDPNRGLGEVDPSALALLQALGLSFVNTVAGQSLPGLAAPPPGATATLDAAGNLTYQSSAGVNNSLTLQRSGDTYVLSDRGVGSIVVSGSGAGNVTGDGTRGISIPASALTSIALDTGDGSDAVNIHATAVPTRVRSTGSAAVNLGNGSARGISGAVSISNPSGRTALSIDDSADAVGRSVSIGAGAVSGLTAAPVTYTPGHLSALALHAGTGSDNFSYTPGTTPVSSVLIMPGPGGNHAVLNGTSGNDSASLAPGSAGLSGPGYRVAIPRDIASVVINGAGGSDAAELFDAPGYDSFSATGTAATLNSTGFSGRVLGFSSINLTSQLGGNDLAKFYDSPARDTFWVQGTTATMSGLGYYNTASGFARVNAYSQQGGGDVALLYDTPGNEAVTLRGTFGQVSGSGYSAAVSGFPRIAAYAQHGGSDSAMLYDTAAGDTFTFRGAFAQAAGAGYLNTASGFGRNGGYSQLGGSDTANLLDTAGADAFRARGTFGQMSSSDYLNTATGFARINAYSQQGGSDSATLLDTPGADAFRARGTFGQMSGSGYYNTATGFARIHAYSQQGGSDSATLLDTAGADAYRTRGTYGQMAGSGYYNTATGFARIAGYSQQGGSDTAALLDTVGADVVLLQGTFGQMSGSGYLITATGFARINAYSQGGADVARLNDTPGNDTFTGSGNTGVLTGAGYRLELTAFPTVHLTSSQGGLDRLVLQNILYTLIVVGPWQ